MGCGIAGPVCQRLRIETIYISVAWLYVYGVCFFFLHRIYAMFTGIDTFSEAVILIVHI